MDASIPQISSKIAKGSLYLIPSPLDGENLWVLPEILKTIIPRLDGFVVENIRQTRRFFVRYIPGFNPDDYQFFQLDKHRKDYIPPTVFAQMTAGKSFGLVSDCGLPAIADPGSKLVLEAHQRKIKVIPIPGPSSIFLALMASGLNGQRFTFHGYLPVKKDQRKKYLREIENHSKRFLSTEIFIETPYRNIALFNDMIKTLNGNTMLCVASALTGKGEWIRTMPIVEWKATKPDIHKKEAVFLISAA